MDTTPKKLQDPCAAEGRPTAGRQAWASKLHKAIRGAKTREALDTLMEGARGGEEWNTAMAATIYRSLESDIHGQWLEDAFANRQAGPVPDAWGEAWMRSQFLEKTMKQRPGLFMMIMEQWPELIQFELQRGEGRFTLLTRASYDGQLEIAHELLTRFDGVIDKTLFTEDNALGRLMFNRFLREDDTSWLRMLNDACPDILYITTSTNQVSMIEMLAERHRDKALDEVLSFSNDHKPEERHGLALIHFAARGVKSAKKDPNGFGMLPLEPEEIMEHAQGFTRTAAVLKKHGHDLEAKAMAKHTSEGTRPRGYPVKGSTAMSYFLKRNKAGSLPSEVLAFLHASMMGLTVDTAAPSRPTGRVARF